MCSSAEAVDQRIDPILFRSVLSHYPTGVCAITAMNDNGPTGFVVGSFTSISLEPALVGFFADKKSTTFPKVQQARAFAVNVLSVRDEHLCRTFAAKGVDRFATVGWRAGQTGSPILDRAIAWIDCTLDRVHEIGDHVLAVGRVVTLADHPEHHESGPLIFHRGAFASCSAALPETRLQ